jgi:hypothetical protein
MPNHRHATAMSDRGESELALPLPLPLPLRELQGLLEQGHNILAAALGALLGSAALLR